jgi:hypothetical protein
LLQKFEYKFGDDFELFWETVINKLKEGWNYENSY